MGRRAFHTAVGVLPAARHHAAGLVVGARRRPRTRPPASPRWCRSIWRPAGLDEHVPAGPQPPGRRRSPGAGRPARPARRPGRPGARGRGPRAASARSRRSGRTARWRPRRPPRRAAPRGSAVVEVALEDPLRRQVAPGARHRGRVDVHGVHLDARHRGEHRGRDGADTAPEVDHDRRPAATSATTSRTSSAVRCRGTNTPGATASRSPQNSTHPTSCSSGSPASRRDTSASRSLGSWPRPRRAAPPPPRRRRSRPRAAAGRAVEAVRRTGARSASWRVGGKTNQRMAQYMKTPSHAPAAIRATW